MTDVGAPSPAEQAVTCSVLQHAILLASWVGEGKPVTAKAVLRRADVIPAGAALGIQPPASVRSAADVRELHWAWSAATAAGLLSVDGKRATAGPALAEWEQLHDDQWLELWLRALSAVAVSTVVSDESEDKEALEIIRLTLSVVDTTSPEDSNLLGAISSTILWSDVSLYDTWSYGQRRHPAESTVEMLTAFGAIDDSTGRPCMTELGRWGLAALNARSSELVGSSAEAPAVDGICQLKITLRYVRPACWRRVLVPASFSLGNLHAVIQAAFGWDDDHLHAFTVGRRQYGDPYFGSENDDCEISVGEVLSSTRKPVRYVYDFGDNWQHAIVLERTLEPDPIATYPFCSGGRGDAPVEDWNEDDDCPSSTPFDRSDINVRLAAVTKR